MLPEELCLRLSAVAEKESRTVSNMAKVLIQESLSAYEEKYSPEDTDIRLKSTEGFRSALEAQQPKRLRGAPQRLKISRKPNS